MLDRILDADGGRFELCPLDPFECRRRYRAERTCSRRLLPPAPAPCASPTPLSFDRRSLPAPGSSASSTGSRVPWRSAGVPAAARLRPPNPARAADPARLGRRDGRDAFALSSWNAGDGDFTLAAGGRATFALTHAHMEPLAGARRRRAPRRGGCDVQADWRARREYEEPGMRRSSAARSRSNCLPSLPPAASSRPPTSLPEQIGTTAGTTASAGCATASTPPRAARARRRAESACGPGGRCLDPHDRAGLRPSTASGGLRTDEEELTVPGYRSAPVRVGNAAAVLQLDTYGSLLEAAWRFWSKTGSPGAARPRRSRRSRTTSRRTGGATPASGSHGRARHLRALRRVLDGTSTGSSGWRGGRRTAPTALARGGRQGPGMNRGEGWDAA